CDLKGVDGCYGLALVYSEGKGVAVDKAKAAALLQTVCETGRAKACGQAGVIYEKGVGVTQDKAKAAGLFEKGCTLGYATSCFAPAALYDRAFAVPDRQGLAKDLARAAGFYDKGCHAVDKERPAESTLPEVLLDPQGNVNRMRALSCGRLGDLYASGSGVPTD